MKLPSRFVPALCALAFIFHSAKDGVAQQTIGTASSLQILQLQARSALLPAVPPNTIELDGNFQTEEGSTPQSGTIQLTVRSDGSYSLISSRSSGAISESRTVTNGFPACTWTDQENRIHNSSFRNCLTPAWFFPGLALLVPGGDGSAPSWAPESYSNDSEGNHLRFHFAVPGVVAGQEDPQLRNPLELVLAPDTYLPLYAQFTVHPDNPGFDAEIPVKIAYSDYRKVSGAMIPFRIQRFVNGNLALDLTITNATVQ